MELCRILHVISAWYVCMNRHVHACRSMCRSIYIYTYMYISRIFYSAIDYYVLPNICAPGSNYILTIARARPAAVVTYCNLYLLRVCAQLSNIFLLICRSTSIGMQQFLTRTYACMHACMQHALARDGASQMDPGFAALVPIREVCSVQCCSRAGVQVWYVCAALFNELAGVVQRLSDERLAACSD